MLRKKFFVVLVFASLTLPAFAIVSVPSQLPPTATPPQPTGLANLKILSDKLECSQEKKICIATGNASAVKLDVPDRQTINADKLIAHFDKEDSKEGEKEEKKGQTKLTHIEAEGNVFMVTGQTIIQGARGTYDNKTEIAHVYENVKITNEENQINGDHGEVDFKTGEYKVDQHAPQQVQALLFTKGKKKLESSKPKSSNPGPSQ